MPTIYHVNHGYRNCTPGEVLDLRPIEVRPDDGFAADYEELRLAFPEGLSLFGYRHIAPGFGQAPSPAKIQLENECERVRQACFPQKTSRFQSFFGLSTLEEAIGFRESVLADLGINGWIWEVEVEHIHHVGDMRLLAPELRLEAPTLQYQMYWRGTSIDAVNAIWECLAKPPVTMIRRLEH